MRFTRGSLMLAAIALAVPAAASSQVGSPDATRTVVERSSGQPRAGTGADEAESPRVYLLGDSYTVQMRKQGLPGDFHAAGRGGRNVKVAPSPSGVQQIREDRAPIARADHVVIALGTNRGDGSRFIDAMELLIGNIRALNPDAALHWVEIGHHTDCWNKPARCYETNKIQKQVRQRNADMASLPVSIIPWAQEAYGHPEWFAADKHRKHPDAAGTRALIGMIVEATR